MLEIDFIVEVPDEEMIEEADSGDECNTS